MQPNEQNERHEEETRDEPRAINDSRKRTPVEPRKVETVQSKPSFKQRWDALQPSKSMLIWACVISVVLTIVIGFNYGGWVTANAAERAAQTMANEAVVQRLAPICFAQFEEDPDRDSKLTEMSEQGDSQRVRYIQEQGWATISGETRPDRNVANACASLILELTP